jgi:hypothetical protein
MIQSTYTPGVCGRCREEKMVVSFFFHWTFDSGMHKLCKDCLKELSLTGP